MTLNFSLYFVLAGVAKFINNVRANVEDFARTEARRVSGQCDDVDKKLTQEIVLLRNQLDGVR